MDDSPQSISAPASRRLAERRRRSVHSTISATATPASSATSVEKPWRKITRSNTSSVKIEGSSASRPIGVDSQAARPMRWRAWAKCSSSAFPRCSGEASRTGRMRSGSSISIIVNSLFVLFCCVPDD
ncbi:hypothetical protein FQZ97_760190 [compost metagenome]